MPVKWLSPQGSYVFFLALFYEDIFSRQQKTR